MSSSMKAGVERRRQQPQPADLRQANCSTATHPLNMLALWFHVDTLDVEACLVALLSLLSAAPTPATIRVAIWRSWQSTANILYLIHAA
eukprot:g18571.t1